MKLEDFTFKRFPVCRRHPTLQSLIVECSDVKLDHRTTIGMQCGFYTIIQTFIADLKNKKTYRTNLFQLRLELGGGGTVSPMLMLYGFDPKVVVTLTAFSFPFSPLASFLTYWKFGGVDWSLILTSAVPAILAGYMSRYI